MGPAVFILFLLGATLPLRAGDCGSIVASVCSTSVDGASGRKVLKIKPSVTAYVVGDRLPVEGRSLLMDPARYGLAPSDGSWRYYALGGIVYRVETGSAVVLEVIRSRHTSHLR